MKAVLFNKPYHPLVETVADPEMLYSTDVIVKVEITAICGSDLHIYAGRETGLDADTIMGHEFVGTVMEVGADVKQFKKGDRVISPFFSACGVCDPCGEGLSCRCDSGQLFGWREKGKGLHGAQAQFVRVPLADHTLMTLPDDLSVHEALLLCDILPTGLFGTDFRPAFENQSLSVVGCGPVGLMAIAGAQFRGWNKVIAFDPDKNRRVMATKMGAIAFDPLNADDMLRFQDQTQGKGSDVVAEAVGSVQAHATSYQIVKKGGNIRSMGVHNEPSFAFSPNDLYNKNITYSTGRCPVQKYWPEALELVRSKKYDVGAIFTHENSVEEAVESYKKFNNKEEGGLKFTLVF
ncbi:MAG: alcohol dehydrogenase catalytic domain-containing protein [Cyclobacteriaceae bacterium]|nr:alcohol dehydrogenase catalytic domain-containing protein [Cyclobacteriaceae bacterium]